MIELSQYTIPCVIFIANIETGEVARFEQNLDPVQGTNKPNCFYWQYGNYSCDCNRRSLFDKILYGRVNKQDNTQCSTWRYKVNIEIKETGKVFYQEWVADARAKVKVLEV